MPSSARRSGNLGTGTWGLAREDAHRRAGGSNPKGKEQAKPPGGEKYLNPPPKPPAAPPAVFVRRLNPPPPLSISRFKMIYLVSVAISSVSITNALDPPR